MKRYEQAGSTILRTDRDGQIDIQTDGKTNWSRERLPARSEVIR